MTHPNSEQLEAFAPYALEAREALIAELEQHPHTSRAYFRSVRELALLTRQMHAYGIWTHPTPGAEEAG
jgi:hypothetical protein